MLHTLKKRLYLYTARYFAFWSNISLKRWNPRIIAITGSVGKTTMLHLMEVQLKSSAHYSHFANSAFGIAFDIVGLRGITDSRLKWLWLVFAVPIKSISYTRTNEFYIVEIDGERPGETEFLAKWLKPEVTLWVSVAKSHAVYFDDQVAEGLFVNVDEAIAHEFSWLAKATENLVIIDAQNEKMIKNTKNIHAERTSIAPSILKKYSVEPNKTTFLMSSGTFMFTNPLPKETYIQLGMLEAVANYLSVQPVHDMSSFIMPPGRSSFFEGKKGMKIIDSTYNAHIISIKSALNMIQEIDAPAKWLVIGDMIEQGLSEQEEHQKLATIMAGVDAEQYILVGRRTNKITAPMLKKLVDESRVISFKSPKEALTYIQKTTTGNEIILFKGSQYLEGIIEHLLANPADARLLCRREAVYQKRREAWGIG